MFDRVRELLDGEEIKSQIGENKYLVLLSGIFLFALWIRLIPIFNMKYLQALDPYMISKLSAHVAEHGFLPMFDVSRYFPYITPTFVLNLGDIYIPAFMFMLISPLTGINFLTWAQISPAIFGALTVISMYLIGKEAFNRKTGLFASFFLAASPAVLHRSSAGWFEKEPIGSFFMMTTIFFVIKAWENKDWISGIAAGLFLGLAATSWGGSNALFLLFPASALVVLLLNEDTEKMLIALTPTLLLGNMIPFLFNNSRWSFPSTYFFISFGVVGLIWLRYLVEDLELVKGKMLDFFTPLLFVFGGLALLLSPLYYQPLARFSYGAIRAGLRTGSGVIGGTVAENAPARASQLIGKLGTGSVYRLFPNYLSTLTQFLSGWTLSLVGLSILVSSVAFMVLSKFLGNKWDRSLLRNSVIVSGVLIATFMVLSLPGTALSAFIPAFLLIIIGSILFNQLSSSGNTEIKFRGYKILIFIWAIFSYIAAARQSRIIFLLSFPVSLLAGYASSHVYSELESLSVWEPLADYFEELNSKKLFYTVIFLFLFFIFIFNGAASFVMSKGTGGSPNDKWLENMEWMREETPVDSVVLSWWDYGYWFETIGARTAVADGGNLGFYMENGKINFPLADFLASTSMNEVDPNLKEKPIDWLKRYSVDYVTLDNTMIGKYSAVSQIHNRNNSQYNTMLQISCVNEGNGCQTISRGNTTYIMYERKLAYPQGTISREILVPIERTLMGGVSVEKPPIVRQGTQGAVSTTYYSRFCSSQGLKRFNLSDKQEEYSNYGSGCLAFNPTSRGRVVQIPEEIANSTLVRLYLMDGHGMDHFEKVFDNKNVKTWKVNYDR